MAIVEIETVEQHGLDHDQLLDGHLEAPQAGAQTDVYAVDVCGWVLGRTAPVTHIEVWPSETAPYWSMLDVSGAQGIPVTIERPDVAARHPSAAGTPCGFLSSLGLVGHALDFEWVLQAVLADGHRVPLATIRGRREALKSYFEPELQPLALTSIGRSGSTWAMYLFAEHPSIVAQREFPDTRAAGYWMRMARILSQPARSEQSMAFPAARASSVGPNPFYGPPITNDPDIRRWLGRLYPRQLVTFCQQAVEQFYLHTARSQRQSQPRYFVEKFEAAAVWPLRELYPGMREIFLVRDFRDLLSSILAIDARRGFYGFGRSPGDTDADYLRRFRVFTMILGQAWRRRAERAHLVRYEDLIREPVETLRRALEYLDLEATPSLVRGMIDAAHDLSAMAPHHRTAPSPLASIGRWRNDLTPAMQELCQDALADVLREFGYEPT